MKVKVLSEEWVEAVGKAINNTQIYILDDNLQILPMGFVGEICIAGDGIASDQLIPGTFKI